MEFRMKNTESKRWLEIFLENAGYKSHHTTEDIAVYSRLVGDFEYLLRVEWLKEENKYIWECCLSLVHDFPRRAPDLAHPKGLVEIDRIRKDDIEDIHLYELKLMNAINMLKR